MVESQIGKSSSTGDNVINVFFHLIGTKNDKERTWKDFLSLFIPNSSLAASWYGMYLVVEIYY
jgi:hypothetical protein